MRKYQAKRKQERKQAPEATQHIQSKIIPFPGVVLKSEDDLQNAIDDFLKQMGYAETYKTTPERRCFSIF